MTRLDWSKARRPRGWDYERSPYRPARSFDLLLAETPRLPTAPASRPPAVTLACLVAAGVNRISIWCAACRTAEQRSINALAAEVCRLPIAELGDALRCHACDGQTAVSPFTEGPIRHVGSNL